MSWLDKTDKKAQEVLQRLMDSMVTPAPFPKDNFLDSLLDRGWVWVGFRPYQPNSETVKKYRPEEYDETWVDPKYQ